MTFEGRVNIYAVTIVNKEYIVWKVDKRRCSIFFRGCEWVDLLWSLIVSMNISKCIDTCLIGKILFCKKQLANSIGFVYLQLLAQIAWLGKYHRDLTKLQ